MLQLLLSDPYSQEEVRWLTRMWPVTTRQHSEIGPVFHEPDWLSNGAAVDTGTLHLLASLRKGLQRRSRKQAAECNIMSTRSQCASHAQRLGARPLPFHQPRGPFKLFQVCSIDRFCHILSCSRTQCSRRRRSFPGYGQQSNGCTRALCAFAVMPGSTAMHACHWTEPSLD